MLYIILYPIIVFHIISLLYYIILYYIILCIKSTKRFWITPSGRQWPTFTGCAYYIPRCFPVTCAALAQMGVTGPMRGPSRTRDWGCMCPDSHGSQLPPARTLIPYLLLKFPLLLRENAAWYSLPIYKGRFPMKIGLNVLGSKALFLWCPGSRLSRSPGLPGWLLPSLSHVSCI